MDIIDDEGRLLGQLNIVDVLVSLLVVAFAVTGIAVVSPFSVGQDAIDQNGSQYRVVTFDAQPAAGLVEPGDEITSGDDMDRTLTVVDVYRTPTADGETAVVALLSVPTDTRGTTLKVGEQRAFETSDYRLNGTVSSMDAPTGELAVATTNVTVETTLSPEQVRAIEVGDEYRIDGERVARIEETTLVPTADGTVRGRLRLTVQTRERDGSHRFGGQPVRLGSEIPFRTGQYSISGTVTGIGDQSLDSEQRETAMRLEATVPTTTADEITAGDEYTVGGRTVTTVDAVEVFPTSDADRKRVQVAATVRTVERDGQTRFLGQDVVTGSNLTLRTNEYSVTGTVLQQGVDTAPRTLSTRTATVRVENVSPTVASAITVGATEQSRNTTYSRVQSKRTAPATVVLTTEGGQIFQREHPVNQDVTMTVALAVRETAAGPRFHGTRLQTSRQVVLDFGSVTVNGTVESVDSR